MKRLLFFIALLFIANYALADTYTVKKGDTAKSISKKLNVSVEQLEQANDPQDLKKLSEGMEIVFNNKTQTKQSEEENFITGLNERQIDILLCIIAGLIVYKYIRKFFFNQP